MIIEIKNKLYNNEEVIIKILKKLECHNIHKTSENEIRFGTDDKGSGSANRIFIDTLSFFSFNRNSSGDIITLVSDIKDISLGMAIKWLCKELNIRMDHKPIVNVNKPFGNFWSSFNSKSLIDDTAPISYSLDKLKEYEYGVSKLWIKDNIGAKTQEVFNVGYDLMTNRITLPWFDECGNLCGIIGRLNRQEVGEKECKYLSLIPMNKSKMLFGLYQNYKNILDNNVCYIFEAEKSTMQMSEFQLNFSTSLGCKVISNRQKLLLKSLCVDYVLAFDEGVSEEEILVEANKLKIKNPFFENKVGYIFDKNNKYLPKGCKKSPSDFGMDIFLKILNECLVWI